MKSIVFYRVSLAKRNYFLLPLHKDEFSFLLFGKFTQHWQNIFSFGFIVNYKPHKILFQACLKSLSFFAFFTLVDWESPISVFFIFPFFIFPAPFEIR